jgi:uncharacterized membrane protein
MDPTENIDNYKLGIIYYNKADHRFMVPKFDKARGYTINFAHKRSYGVVLLIISIPAIVWLWQHYNTILFK